MPLATASSAEPVERMTFIISSNPGGTFDIYSRFAASHLGRFLPGNPTITPQNMPGGAGVRAANYLYNIAPKDGTVIGMIDPALYLSQILGTPELKANALEFNWIGRLVGTASVLIVRPDAAVKKIEDAYTQELILSASGTVSRLNWSLLNNVVGTKIKMITGYKGVPDARLAMVRKEIDGLAMSWWDLKILEGGSWITEKKVNLLLQTSTKRHAELPDVPLMLDLAKNDEDRRLIYLFSQPDDVGRSIVAPPGLAAEQVAQLRKAFLTAMNDEAVRADAAKAQLGLDPMSGEQVLKLLMDSGNISDTMVQRARAIAAPK
jgi:tripartite-type tricarboxylate transporter receptor subunit TctC